MSWDFQELQRTAMKQYFFNNKDAASQIKGLYFYVFDNALVHIYVSTNPYDQLLQTSFIKQVKYGVELEEANRYTTHGTYIFTFDPQKNDPSTLEKLIKIVNTFSPIDEITTTKLCEILPVKLLPLWETIGLEKFKQAGLSIAETVSLLDKKYPQDKFPDIRYELALYFEPTDLNTAYQFLTAIDAQNPHFNEAAKKIINILYETLNAHKENKIKLSKPEIKEVYQTLLRYLCAIQPHDSMYENHFMQIFNELSGIGYTKTSGIESLYDIALLFNAQKKQIEALQKENDLLKAQGLTCPKNDPANQSPSFFK